MVAVPSIPPVALNVPVVLPAGMVTLAGVKVTPPTGLEVSPITVSTVVGTLSVSVPGMLWVSPTLVELNPTVIAGVVTVTVADPGWNPDPADARMLVVPAASGVTVTLVPVEFSGTIAEEGREITVGLKPDSVTVTPPAPAGVPRVIVRIPGESDRLRGFGLSVICIALAVIMTVEGALLANPSLTIN